MWLYEFGNINNTVFYVFCAVATPVCLIALANILIGWCMPRHGGATSLDSIIGIGTIVLSYTVLVRGIDPDWGSVRQYETICQCYPALLLIGLTMFIGGICVKGWGIYVYNKYNTDRRPLGEEWKAQGWIWLLLIIAGVVSIIWVVIDTPEIIYIDKGGDSTEHKSKTETYECYYEHGEAWLIATSAWHGLLFLLAVCAVGPNCSVSHTMEAYIHSVITINMLMATVAAICTRFLYDDKGKDNTEEYTVNGALVLWTCLFTNIFSLGRKMCGPPKNKKYTADDKN